MAITPYQIGNVLSAYTRQNKLDAAPAKVLETVPEAEQLDAVLLVKEEKKTKEFDKISCNLRDIILKSDKI